MKKRMGFDLRWYNWIYSFVSSAIFSILVNSSPKGYFRSRWLRQGDPLSPMLFVIVVEALHALLEKRLSSCESLKGYSVEHFSMAVNHLKFANDAIVFCDSIISEIDSLKAILRWFELMSWSENKL